MALDRYAMVGGELSSPSHQAAGVTFFLCSRTRLLNSSKVSASVMFFTSAVRLLMREGEMAWLPVARRDKSLLFEDRGSKTGRNRFRRVVASNLDAGPATMNSWTPRLKMLCSSSSDVCSRGEQPTGFWPWMHKQTRPAATTGITKAAK